MNKKVRILQTINLFRLIPIWIIINMQSVDRRKLIFEEIEHWNKCVQLNLKGKFNIFSVLILKLKEYRSLLYYRCGGGKILIKIFFPPMESLYINTREIGPRFFIQHGFATNISAKSIGSDCWVNQQVTIGYTFDKEPPVIGNGVRISAGAKVLGNIKVDNNVIVAANAVVIKNVEKNMIVGGVPAKIIGTNVNYKLWSENND